MSDQKPNTQHFDSQINKTLNAISENAEIAPFWLAAIINSAEDAIISKSLEGIITSWNRGAESLFGYEAYEVIGKSIEILIPLDHINEEPGIIARLKRGEQIDHFETIRVRKDGSLVNISLTVSPIKDASGKVIGASKIARDITDRKIYEKHLHEALRQARDAQNRAEEASRLKDEFLATISHELRTPLNAILGWLSLLVEGNLDEVTAQKALSTIWRNAKSQAQLIEDLLDVSRIANGQLRLSITPFSATSLIMTAVESIKPLAQDKRIRLQMIVDSSADTIVGDAERLKQVIWNLLSNAIKFTPPNGNVCIELGRTDNHVKITVKDDGIGIQPEFLPRVFDHFSQADGSTTRSYGGLGVGLAIVKSIVEMHNGSIEVESNGINQGTTFTVFLPFKEDYSAANSESRNDDAESRITPEHRTELKNLKIMVVDDEKDTCEMISIAFEQCGANVVTATSAGEALRKLSTWTPDVLVSDISMPEIDGYELIKQIKSSTTLTSTRDIPAVALTAMVRVEDRLKALAAGYQMHVSKPIEIAELRAAVASLASIMIKDRN
jgi:PAS domain S-box-containing protein